MKRALLFLTLAAAMAAERKSVFPVGVKPVGPFSPGIQSGDFLYVSGQGARDLAGKLPPDIEGQTRQSLENVKNVIETGGLKMKDVVYTQIYLTDIANYAAMDKVFKTFFPANAPVRCVIGVKRMPLDTPVEISAVATAKQGKRVYVPGTTLEGAVRYLSTKKLKLTDVAFANIYLTSKAPRERVEEMVKKNFNPSATIVYLPVNELPDGAMVEMTGIAGQTDFYSAHSGTTADKILEDIRKDLTAAGMTMDNVVASNVYVDSIDNFAPMNKIYATFFGQPAPTRTTVQPVTTGNTISVIAVK
ncbi:MAG: RidA family protein [Bryobacteraceae bacterium]